MNLEISPIVLDGKRVRLEPLTQHHAEGIYNCGRTETDWVHLPRGSFIDIADTKRWIDKASLSTNQQAFAIIEKANNTVVGSSRFLNIRPEHRGLEIGWTWLESQWHRTGLNTEVKLLLLGHAFEKLGCVRVEFKADSRNATSLKALERIGAIREGVLRRHMIVQDNHVRDSVYFSVLDIEWSDVKSRLSRLLER
jgi:RimJ/RimL family protein N-acetyltransferase